MDRAPIAPPRPRRAMHVTAASNSLALLGAARLARARQPLAAATQLAIAVFGTSMRLAEDPAWVDALRHHDAIACGANLVLAAQASRRSRRVRAALTAIAVLWPARYVTWHLAGPQSAPDVAVQVLTHLVNLWGWW